MDSLHLSSGGRAFIVNIALRYWWVSDPLSLIPRLACVTSYTSFGIRFPPLCLGNEYYKLVSINLFGVVSLATAPFAAVHTPLEDTHLGGYFIPKRTVCLMHIQSAHLDPRHWDNPEDFNPDRWIGQDGKLLRHEAFYPFSIGETCKRTHMYIYAHIHVHARHTRVGC
jgi:hypothetical protein